MGKINKGRVLLGGLLAGLVLIIIHTVIHRAILGEQWAKAMADLNKPLPTGSAVVGMVVIMFLVGIFIVWLYAAIRPRYGAGPKTAVLAGLAVWFILWLIGFGGLIFMDLLPCNLVGTGVGLGLGEAVVAALAGGWVYKEEEEVKEEVREEPVVPTEPSGPPEPPGTI